MASWFRITPEARLKSAYFLQVQVYERPITLPNVGNKYLQKRLRNSEKGWPLVILAYRRLLFWPQKIAWQTCRYCWWKRVKADGEVSDSGMFVQEFYKNSSITAYTIHIQVSPFWLIIQVKFLYQLVKKFPFYETRCYFLVLKKQDMPLDRMLCYFLGPFAKLRKATVSFVISVHLFVCPSVHMEQLGSQWKDFHEIWFLKIF